MPTFVIQTLGRPANKVTVEASPIRIGRDEGNDIVLPDDTVSRSHAVVERGADGRWSVGCVSETNPIVVNGAMTRERVGLTEGSEVLVGSAFLLIFSENEEKANGYATGQALYQRSRCVGCSWEGMVLKARKAPACPQCHGAELVEVDGYSGEARRALGQSERPSRRLQTSAMDPDTAKKMLRTIKAAKGSHIERLDAEGSPLRTELTEDKPVEIARSADPALRLEGLAFGHVTVAWDGRRFRATSAMLFPAMKVNGEKKKSAALGSGDVIAIGGNEFKFVTE